MIAQKSPFAGKTIEPSMLVNVPRLVTAYFTGKPDPTVASQRVAFGTSGHRGSAFDNAFNEAHILAIIIGAKAASTAHCLSALTRTRCPSPP